MKLLTKESSKNWRQTNIREKGLDFSILCKPILGTDCFEDWKSDGQCDDINNKETCGFDEGDCCGKDAINQYCMDCRCLSNVLYL